MKTFIRRFLNSFVIVMSIYFFMFVAVALEYFGIAPWYITAMSVGGISLMLSSGIGLLEA